MIKNLNGNTQKDRNYPPPAAHIDSPPPQIVSFPQIDFGPGTKMAPHWSVLANNEYRPYLIYLRQKLCSSPHWFLPSKMSFSINRNSHKNEFCPHYYPPTKIFSSHFLRKKVANWWRVIWSKFNVVLHVEIRSFFNELFEEYIFLTHLPSTNFQTVFCIVPLDFSILKIRVRKYYTSLLHIFNFWLPTTTFFFILFSICLWTWL